MKTQDFTNYALDQYTVYEWVCKHISQPNYMLVQDNTITIKVYDALTIVIDRHFSYVEDRQCNACAMNIYTPSGAKSNYKTRISLVEVAEYIQGIVEEEIWELCDGKKVKAWDIYEGNPEEFPVMPVAPRKLNK